MDLFVNVQIIADYVSGQNYLSDYYFLSYMDNFLVLNKVF